MTARQLGFELWHLFGDLRLWALHRLAVCVNYLRCHRRYGLACNCDPAVAVTSVLLFALGKRRFLSAEVS